MKKAFVTTLYLISTVCFGQNKQCYHSFDESTSDVHINQWNIDKENLSKTYVKETADSKNRVIELQFFKDNSLEYPHLCYLNVWIKYEYPNDSTIIEYYLEADGKENAGIECDVPSKTAFTLSNDKRKIIHTKSEYNFDKSIYMKNGWTEENLSNAVGQLRSEKKIYRMVQYYSKSFYKLAGIFPVSDNYKLEEYLFNDVEKKEILKALKTEQ